MKPSLGRIVIYHDPNLVSNGSTEHPAIVTRVWTDESVNLTVFPDCGTPVSKTSALLQRASLEVYWRWPE